MTFDKDTLRITDAGSFGKMALGVGAVGTVACLVGFLALGDAAGAQLSHSYLAAFVFWVTVGLGGLFFTMLHHLVSATWSVVVRRLAEAVMCTLPLLFLFFIPIAVFSIGDLYHWAHPGHDAVLQEKSPWLNTGMYIGRGVLYFVIWSVLAFFLSRKSLEQDTSPGEKVTARMKQLSALGMVLFALSLTFAAFDWLMSLNPHWYSTIFGVTLFAGGFVGVLSFMTVTLVLLRRRGILEEQVTIEHYHDLGKLIFAFTIFWTYVSFSQFFLIWYGNLPEETAFYHHRWHGSWKWVSVVLIMGHFVIPFLFLLSREPKRNVKCMLVASVWMLIMHWVEMYWQVMPHWRVVDENGSGAALSIWDPLAFVGIGGFFLFFFWRRFSSHPLIPVGDEDLDASLRFTNM
jgi:hypothetical protein